jgi:hypothetical protein
MDTGHATVVDTAGNFNRPKSLHALMHQPLSARYLNPILYKVNP